MGVQPFQLPLQDIYEINISTGKYKRITTGKGTASTVAVADDGTVAYIGHRDVIPRSVLIPSQI